MKTYVLTVSKKFPKTHKRAGHNTNFTEKIACATFCPGDCDDCDFNLPKIHTIRSNYYLWAKRVNEVNQGKAIISIRYWSGMPYRSKQVELHKLESAGIEKLEHPDNFVFATIEGKEVNWEDVAKNDGLMFEDFCEWFKVRQKEPMAIIHFTDFRYKN